MWTSMVCIKPLLSNQSFLVTDIERMQGKIDACRESKNITLVGNTNHHHCLSAKKPIPKLTKQIQTYHFITKT